MQDLTSQSLNRLHNTNYCWLVALLLSIFFGVEVAQATLTDKTNVS